MADVRAARLQNGGEHWGVNLTFTEAGARALETLTLDASQAQPPANQLMMLVDGKFVSAPSVRTPVAGGVVVLSGDFDKDEAKALTAAIRGPSVGPSA